MPKKVNTSSFVAEAIKLNNTYDYSLVSYTKAISKVEIICKTHGSFFISPNNLLQGHGCPSCSKNKKMNTDEFIKKAKLIFDSKFDYSSSIYTGMNNKVKIICPEHGEFEQRASHHLNGHGCSKCYGNNVNNTIEFIQKANDKHNKKYDYSNVIYEGAKKQIKIICHTHGDFLQMPYKHLEGHGCYKCNISKGEIEIRRILDELSINYIQRKSFSTCRNTKTNKLLFFDFYLPQLNYCIEYDGEQHFRSVDYFGGEKTLSDIIFRDEIKNKYCINNKIKLLRIQSKDFKKIKIILENFLSTN